MKKENRVELFGVRTAQMSNEMYNFVMQQINETPGKTFKDYAFKLIRLDMQQKQTEQANKEKDMHVHDILLELQEQMSRGFNKLETKIDKRTYTTALSYEETKTSDIEEGLLITDKITGEINEDYNNDF